MVICDEMSLKFSFFSRSSKRKEKKKKKKKKKKTEISTLPVFLMEQ